VECNHTNGKEIMMDARVDYGNPIAAKFAKHINSAGAVVSGSTLGVSPGLQVPT
jgi:hypothetical protein